ncbi:MAG TPA: nuclear transport factor 2 family protein [Pseudolysinimonas sp.]|nr:nuclear transport factor 2 family protein [Pseudolysinimonas sp.]
MSEGFAPGWASRQSLVSLGIDPTNVDTVGAADRHNILNTVNRYAWAYDERQIDVLSDVFSENAVWFGSVTGTIAIAPIESRNAIVEWLQGHMAAQSDQRRHNITNSVVVSQTPGAATVICYLLLTTAFDGSVGVVTTGTYQLDLVREEDGVWRITRFAAGFDAPF